MMKVNIWIHKSDAVAGTVTDYELTRPYHDRNNEWVQVSISVDDFAQLDDIATTSNEMDFTKIYEKNPDTGVIRSRKPGDYENTKPVDYRSDSWRVSQYNRNREHADRIEDIDEMDQNNAPFGD